MDCLLRDASPTLTIMAVITSEREMLDAQFAAAGNGRIKVNIVNDNDVMSTRMSLCDGSRT